jgi:hypothetical protein
VEGCGIVFQLQPPAHKGRPWKENVLYRFHGKGDGGLPEGGVTVDTAGNLFGTTTVGGKTTGFNGLGVVFELSPQSNGKWTDKTIYAFQTLGSFHPYSGVVMDATGKLYGTTFDGGNLKKCFSGACGTVYQLVPPKQDGAWKFTVLHGFGGAPDGTFLVGTLFLQGGKLYGAAAYGGDEKTQECKNGGCGLVYQTAP